jgi:hypothetical protein
MDAGRARAVNYNGRAGGWASQETMSLRGTEFRSAGMDEYHEPPPPRDYAHPCELVSDDSPAKCAR